MSTIRQEGTGKFIRKLLRAILVSLAIILLTTYGWQSSHSGFHEDPLLGTSSQRLEQTVRYLSDTARARNVYFYDSLNRAAQHIDDSFRSLGYTVESWPYEVKGKMFRNIVARLQNNDSREYVLVGAHYDSCFNPGADDNASGIAGLLELAGMLKKEALKTNIMFVAFTNEEPPFFQTNKMGSRIFVTDLQARNILVKNAVVLEMIGFYSDKLFSQKYPPLLGPFYPDQGNFIAIVGNLQSYALVRSVEDNFKKATSFPMASIITPGMIPGLNFSDHASFWDAGIPAIMVTDTAYFRNPNYHLDSDKANTLDFKRMAAVIDGLRKAIINIENQNREK